MWIRDRFKPVRNFTADLTGTCTDSMLVQHMAGSGVAQDAAVSTPSFFDMNVQMCIRDRCMR